MLEENLTPLYVRKKIYHQKLGEKSSYPSQITHTPRQKSNGRPLSATFLEVKVKPCFFGRYFTCKTMQVSLALALLLIRFLKRLVLIIMPQNLSFNRSVSTALQLVVIELNNR